MPNPEPTARSPLSTIKEKERVLEKEIQAAQEQASILLADARAKADAVKQQAEREGLSHAEALYQQGLERAREQAAAITQEGQAQAQVQHEKGLQRIPQAVDHILAFVLPHID